MLISISSVVSKLHTTHLCVQLDVIYNSLGIHSAALPSIRYTSLKWCPFAETIYTTALYVQMELWKTCMWSSRFWLQMYVCINPAFFARSLPPSSKVTFQFSEEAVQLLEEAFRFVAKLLSKLTFRDVQIFAYGWCFLCCHGLLVFS